MTWKDKTASKCVSQTVLESVASKNATFKRPAFLYMTFWFNRPFSRPIPARKLCLDRCLKPVYVFKWADCVVIYQQFIAQILTNWIVPYSSFIQWWSSIVQWETMFSELRIYRDCVSSEEFLNSYNVNIFLFQSMINIQTISYVKNKK